MPTEKTITVWDRWDENKSDWSFNHISDGWDDSEKPTPRGELQSKSWPSGKWKKTKSKLINNVVQMSD